MLDTRREDFLITKKNVKSQCGKNKTENGAGQVVLQGTILCICNKRRSQWRNDEIESWKNVNQNRWRVRKIIIKVSGGLVMKWANVWKMIICYETERPTTISLEQLPKLKFMVSNQCQWVEIELPNRRYINIKSLLFFGLINSHSINCTSFKVVLTTLCTLLLRVFLYELMPGSDSYYFLQLACATHRKILIDILGIWLFLPNAASINLLDVHYPAVNSTSNAKWRNVRFLNVAIKSLCRCNTRFN